MTKCYACKNDCFNIGVVFEVCSMAKIPGINTIFDFFFFDFTQSAGI